MSHNRSRGVLGWSEYGLAVTFLRRVAAGRRAVFWEAVAENHAGVPATLQELARGDSSVVCDAAEAAASMA
jgi:hypothetical protein